jgi:hypothetical protein
MLQTALADAAPVLTPRTLDRLIQRLDQTEEGHRPAWNRWRSVLEDVRPLIAYIRTLFLPVVQAQTKRQFESAFDSYSLAFQPYRLFVIAKFVPLVQEPDFLQSYQDALRQGINQICDSGPSKGFEVGRLRNLVNRYFEVLSSISRTIEAGVPHSQLVTPDHLPVFEEFFGYSTRFDFGLTAICLVVEGSLPVPQKRIAKLMVATSESVLSDLEQYSVIVAKLQTGTNWQKSLADFHRTRHRPRDKETVEAVSVHVVGASDGDAKRVAELAWLKKRPTLSKEFGGKWIVVEKDRLIASNVSYETARIEALKVGIRRPFIFYVAPEEEAFMGV